MACQLQSFACPGLGRQPVRSWPCAPMMASVIQKFSPFRPRMWSRPKAISDGGRGVICPPQTG